MVVGHVAESLPESVLAGTAYVFIYAFHMPAFVLITGYLGRRFPAGPAQMRALLLTLIAPYLIFQALHAAVRIPDRGHFDVDVFEPVWTLWFLLSLVAWRLLTPVFLALRYPVVISVLLSLTAGLGSGVTADLSLGRTPAFLPFYVLGACATPERVHRLRTALASAPLRLAAAATLWLAVGAAYLVHDSIERRSLWMRDGYADLGMTDVAGAGYRLGLLAVGLLLALAVLALVPRRVTWFTWLGTVTLYVYLLHAVLLNPLRPVLTELTLPEWQVAGLLSAPSCWRWVLGSRAVRLLTRPLVEPATLARRRPREPALTA